MGWRGNRSQGSRERLIGARLAPADEPLDPSSPGAPPSGATASVSGVSVVIEDDWMPGPPAEPAADGPPVDGPPVEPPAVTPGSSGLGVAGIAQTRRGSGREKIPSGRAESTAIRMANAPRGSRLEPR